MNRLVLSSLVLAAAAGAARADFTTLGSSGEAQIPAIINMIYGAGGETGFNFTPDSAGQPTSFDNGKGQTLVRINDGSYDAAHPLQIHGNDHPGSTDQVWKDGTVHVNAQAKYAGNGQAFGWIDGATGGTQHQLFPITGNGLLSGSAVTSFTAGSASLFRLYDDTGGNVWSSKTSENSDGHDHMLTFELLGFGRKAFIVFFEDLPIPGADQDFNDLAVELSVVPLPPAAYAGLGTLAGVAGIGYLRRRRLTLV